MSDDQPTQDAQAVPAEAADRSAGGGAERALERLEGWASDPEPGVIIVCGQAPLAGALIGVFAARVCERFRTIRLSNPRVDPDALSRRILETLGELDDERPRASLARVIQEPDAAPLLLLIEEADVLSPRSEMWLFDLVRRSGGALRAVLAIADPKPASELAAAYSGRTEVVPIGEAEGRAPARAGAGRIARERAAIAHARREDRESLEVSAGAATGEGAAVVVESARAQGVRAPARAKPQSAPGARRPVASPEVARRDGTLRWLVLPGALAACFVAGFVTSELLQALRASRGVDPAQASISAPSPEPTPPSVASAPPSAPPAADAIDSQPQPPPASARPAPVLAQPPPAALPTPVSAPSVNAERDVASAPPVAPAPAVEAPPAEAPDAAPPAPERRRARAPARPSGPPPVTVGISAEPGTEISVDGRSLGSAPVEEVELASGPHRLVAKLPDGRVIEHVVDVKKGPRYDIRVR